MARESPQNWLHKHIKTKSLKTVRMFHGIYSTYTYTGIILSMRPSNERRRYGVASSLIGWAHAQNDPDVQIMCTSHNNDAVWHWDVIPTFSDIYRYNVIPRSIYFQILTNDTAIARPLCRIMRVIRGNKLWFIFCHSHYSDVCNIIMLY